VLNDLSLKAPSAGVVVTRVREPGEIVAAGSPIVELVDLDHYLKAYVPEAQIGRLRLGLPAQVWTDAFPGQPFAATVKNIGQRAEFTPKEVQTPTSGSSSPMRSSSTWTRTPSTA
jgi:HlyD family secretion protein